jgi:hypothetical protein
VVGRFLILCLGLTIFVAASPGLTTAQDTNVKPDITKAPAKTDQLKTEDTTTRPEIASEYLLPASTKAWFSIPDYSKLKEGFDGTMLGQLAKDEQLKPFIDSMSNQFQDWLNNQNVRLGIDIADVQAVRTGEICIAGVLRDRAGEQDDQLGRDSHGVVLLVDVSQTEEKARELLKKVDSNFESRNATRGEVPNLYGIAVTKWTVQRPKFAVKSRSTFHAIANGWMIASNNESVFREIVRRLVNFDKVNAAESLISNPSFVAIARHTNVEGVVSDIRWFIDPFGYVKLAQAIQEEDLQKKVKKDDWARILEQEGFDALKGIGGQVSFGTSDHEILHRTFIYAPRNGANGANQKRFFGLFDFTNSKKQGLKPESWVPNDVSAYFSCCWDMSLALKNVAGVVDSFMKEQGSFDNIMNSLKSEMNVDVPKLVASFDNRVVILSSTSRPITEDSERVAICVPIIEGENGLLEVIERALGGEGSSKSIKVLGKRVLVVDSSEELLDEDELEIWTDPIDAEDANEVPAPQGNEFQLFEKKFFTVVHQHFIVCNNKEYLEEIIRGKNSSELAEMDDYEQIRNSLSKLVDEKNISFRHFGRIDRSLETNYEMLRQGKMVGSNTVLARTLNRIFTSGEEIKPEGAEPRVQKLDGSKLPEDYLKCVAPYLGPMGWVFETDDEGWRVTGCLLKKKNLNEVVQKPAESPRR